MLVCLEIKLGIFQVTSSARKKSVVIQDKLFATLRSKQRIFFSLLLSQKTEEAEDCSF